MLRRGVIFLFLASGLATPADAEYPSDNLLAYIPTVTFNNVPANGAACTFGTVSWTEKQLKDALTMALGCNQRPDGGCEAKGKDPKKYPRRWFNNGNDNSPVWMCGGANAAVDVWDFPLLNPPTWIFPTNRNTQGLYRVFYQNVPGTTTITYCGVANHIQDSTGYDVCHVATTAIAAVAADAEL